MTPGQARIALLSFLVVMTGVVINALFLQARPAVATRAVIERPPARAPADRGRRSSEAIQIDRSAPRAPYVAAGEHPLRIARFALASARLDGPPDAPQEDASAKTVGAIQRELSTRGYGPLAGDGVIGLATRAAIMAFEHDHGLALTGEASERMLERIVFGTAAGMEAAGGGRARSAQAEQIIRTVQQRLAALGYQLGRADGRLGEETVKAIRDFEMDKGLVPKGRISAELVARLGEAAATRASGR
jgi:peptidoglycan hydrolase-like protein with peptidoglycan-binding domain